MPRRYEHLGLARWPFPIVPERDYCVFIADRRQLRLDIDGLLTTLSRRETSSIHLFWSWFGAGKTHTLFYFANRAAENSNNKAFNILYPVYSEFPKAARSFLDVYRAFVTNLNAELLIDAYFEAYTSESSERLRKDLILASPDLANALQVMATGNSQDQLTAVRWLRAESLLITEFRRVGISQKINSSEESIRILAALIGLLKIAAQCKGYPGCRVVWMLDEFQRIERTGQRILDEINTGLHSAFNACPNGLSLLLSFSGRPQSHSLPPWFSREFRDRIGRTKTLILPPMLPEEALEFVRDILTQLRIPEYGHLPPYFPFTEQSCKAIIEEVKTRGELKPRSIMHAFNSVLQEADPKLEDGEIDHISPEFAMRVLGTYVVLDDDEES